MAEHVCGLAGSSVASEGSCAAQSSVNCGSSKEHRQYLQLAEKAPRWKQQQTAPQGEQRRGKRCCCEHGRGNDSGCQCEIYTGENEKRRERKCNKGGERKGHGAYCNCHAGGKGRLAAQPRPAGWHRSRLCR